MMTRTKAANRALILTLTTLIVSAHASAETLTKEMKSTIIDSIQKTLVSEAFVPGTDFSRWSAYVEKHRAAIDAADNEVSFQRAIDATLKEFGFSHIRLLTPANENRRQSDSTVGIGVRIEKVKDGLLVLRVTPRTPAAFAGIEPGDTIIEIDGKKAESVVGLQGKEGEPASLKIRKDGGKVKSLKVKRENISVSPPAILTKVSPEASALKIADFNKGYNEILIEQLVTQASKDSKRLIIDLRGNGGGVIANMTHLMSLIVPAKTPIGITVSKDLVNMYVHETKGNPNDMAAIIKWTPLKLRATGSSAPIFKGSVAVLVDSSSGSSSEMFAAALRETINAPIIGEKSSGRVLASVFRKLPHGYSLQIPIQDYVTMQGYRIEGKGVIPDIVVKQPRFLKSGQTDETIQKAILLLQRQEAIRSSAH